METFNILSRIVFYLGYMVSFGVWLIADTGSTRETAAFQWAVLSMLWIIHSHVSKE